METIAPLGGDNAAVLFRIDPYMAKRLSRADLGLIETLNQQCTEFFMLQNGLPPSEADAREVFEKFPAGCNAEDKLAIGLFDCRDTMVGMFDIVRGYRLATDWYVGLALITPDCRGNRLGTTAHQALAEYARRAGAEKLLIAVLKANHRARRFWKNLGYRKVKDYPPRQIGIRIPALTEFEFDL